MYFVNDLHRKKSFGPYPSKRVANKHRTQIKIIPDLLLEIGTNVGISNTPDFPMWDYSQVLTQNKCQFESTV